MASGGLSNKRKGNLYERELARSMSAKRRPLSGASGGGDIAPRPGTIWADWSWEAKRRKRLPAFVTNALTQAATDIALGDPRKPAVLMREDHGRTIFVAYWDDIRPWCEAVAETGHGSRLRALAKELRAISLELERLT